MPTKTVDPDLAMTEQQVAAILADAQDEAAQAARAVEQAEATARGEAPSAGLAMKAADITPAKLTELRAAADLAGMRAVAAERRTGEIREKRKLAEWEAVRAKIRAEAADDLDAADHLVAKLDAFEAALSELCEAVKGHNDRIAGWARLMGSAGVFSHGERSGPEGFSYDINGAYVCVDAKTFRPFVGAELVGATVHRVMERYPRAFRQYDGRELVARDLMDAKPFSGPPLDLRARIRRDA